MMRSVVLFLIFQIGGMSVGFSQVSQDCSEAVPICRNTPVNGGTNGYGIDDFNGADRTGCIVAPTDKTIESNSSWYKFRTGASGQLGFNISFNAEEDWDFALYKSSDCGNLGDPIRCEFFDNNLKRSYIGVGEDPTGAIDSSLYDDWLQVSPGEDYYLLINNFSNNNSGFSIQFSGNIFVTNPNDALDCSIVSNLLGAPISVCDSDTVVLNATTTDASLYTWFKDIGTGFGLISGENNATLAVNASALYRVQVTTPTSIIISDVQVAFAAIAGTFPLADTVVCSGIPFYDLSQKDSEALGGQDSEIYMVSYHASIGDALNGVSSLSIQHAISFGTETIFARTTSRENPECFDLPQSFQLITLNTPVLNISTEVYLCKEEASIAIGEITPNSNYTYLWNTGETTPEITVLEAGEYSLVVANTISGQRCVTTSTITVSNSQAPKISKIIMDEFQTNNSIVIVTEIEGNYEYKIDLGAFQAENEFKDVLPGLHKITIKDLNGCGSLTESVVVVGFPAYFTPNGDGIHDVWHVTGISSLNNPIVQVYDRYGVFLVQLDGVTISWNGMLNGQDLAATDYWFRLSYLDDKGGRVSAKYVNGHFSLKR
ncbi:MAG: T9SS type B sorting domain-containing protein [Cellulophaga sp.]